MTNDDMAEALGMTAADAAHDADCKHFREATMLAVRVMQAEERVDQLEAGIRRHKAVIGGARDYRGTAWLTDCYLWELVETTAADPSGDDAA